MRRLEDVLQQEPRAHERGTALSVVVHVLLLLLVLGQVVYLASRYRVRVDMTSDKLWTTTGSTKTLLGKLEERLIVEAYFSPKEKLPLVMSSSRDWADNFLDEIVQLGNGRVIVQRFDPNSDVAVAKTATRLGIQPINLSSQSATSLSVDQHWQGLRLIYGGGKQKVIEKFVPGNSFLAEALVTPKIKEVITAEKRRIGYMEWPARVTRGRQQKTVGWSLVRTHPGLVSRYEFQNFKDQDGALLPSGLDTLFLFRPMLLTDRQKYVIDQFVMGGGTLVVFADAAEYSIDQQRSFKQVPFALDAKESKYQLLQQWNAYGLEWRPKLIADMQQDAYTPQFDIPQEYYATPVGSRTGQAEYLSVQYPYFFHALNFDWSTIADQLAIDAAGKVDDRLAAQYRKTLLPGMPSDDFLFLGFKKRLNRGPGFYWPTWVGLRERAGGVVDLPDGVTGRVLLRSSPLALLEDPPQVLDPAGADPRQIAAQRTKFMNHLNDRIMAEPRQQAPLMVEVTGRFHSFFANKETPKRPSQIEEEKNKAADVGGEDGSTPDSSVPDSSGVEKRGDEQPANVNREPAKLTEAASPGRIVMVGDATFLRDDVLGGDYQQIGGPVSGQSGMPFFAGMLDWLSGDRDLSELQQRVPADRTLTLIAANSKPNEDPRNTEQALRSKTSWLVWLNVVLPGLLLSAFGTVLWLIRRNQKRAFLVSLQGS
jgi:ABC-type uncharacterized transport system involved in gliding motility auxiliary subunit